MFLYGGLPFLRMARPEIGARRPGMMTLISLAISVAFVYSLATRLLPGTEPFFWELVTLIDVMLLGHWLEMRSVRQASGALDHLARLLPDTAERLRPDGTPEQVPLHLLAEGDIVLIRPGAGVPADGEIVDGDSTLNEAMITGESRPVAKAAGDPVVQLDVGQPLQAVDERQIDLRHHHRRRLSERHLEGRSAVDADDFVVRGTDDDASAEQIARSVAESVLVKTEIGRAHV